jgi:predicted anti-sigma-YlaC factor YlaD
MAARRVVKEQEDSVVMAAGTMTCKEIAELVTEYLEHTLPRAERARFEDHLHGCQGCLAYLEQTRLTIRSIGHLTEDDIPAPVLQSLLGAFRRWKLS